MQSMKIRHNHRLYSIEMLECLTISRIITKKVTIEKEAGNVHITSRSAITVGGATSILTPDSTGVTLVY